MFKRYYKLGKGRETTRSILEKIPTIVGAYETHACLLPKKKMQQDLSKEEVNEQTNKKCSNMLENLKALIEKENEHYKNNEASFKDLTDKLSLFVHEMADSVISLACMDSSDEWVDKLLIVAREFANGNPFLRLFHMDLEKGGPQLCQFCIL